METLNGPKTVDWLKRHGYNTDEKTLGSRARRLRDWAEGTNPSVYAADRILNKFDLRPDELPDYCWEESE